MNSGFEWPRAGIGRACQKSGDEVRKDRTVAKKLKATNPFTFRWRIISMSAWDNDYIDEEVPAFIEFDDMGWGEFHFGYVHGRMDCRLATRDGQPAVEWTWDGNDEMDPAQGRGWAGVKDCWDDLLVQRRRLGVRGEED
jgi:hypothetical protein